MVGRLCHATQETITAGTTVPEVDTSRYQRDPRCLSVSDVDAGCLHAIATLSQTDISLKGLAEHPGFSETRRGSGSLLIVCNGSFAKP